MFDKDICQPAPRALLWPAKPLPAPGATVYCLHAWPKARPARQRPRCNLLGALRLLGVVGESGGGARPLRGTDHSARPAGVGVGVSLRSATAVRLALARVPAAGGGPLGSGLLGSTSFPPPTHPPRLRRKERGWRARPPL